MGGGWLVADQPTGRGFTETLASGALSPGFAVGASLLWTAGLAIGMVLYHRSIDDHEERAWLWACVAGWYALLFPAPARSEVRHDVNEDVGRCSSRCAPYD